MTGLWVLASILSMRKRKKNETLLFKGSNIIQSLEVPREDVLYLGKNPRISSEVKYVWEAGEPYKITVNLNANVNIVI